MPIHLACPHCGRNIAAPDKLAGKKGRCPHCRATMRVPVDGSTAVTLAPASVSPSAPPPKPTADSVEPNRRRSLLRRAGAITLILALTGICGAFFADEIRAKVKGAFESITTADAATENSSEDLEAATGAEGEDASDSASDGDDAVASAVSSTADAGLAQRVHQILEKNCYSCHGEGGAAEGGFNFVLRRDKLVEDSYVTPGDPNGSYLFERIRDGDMPPRGEEVRPSEEEIALISQWIEAGAPDFSAPIERSFVSHEETFRLLREDVEAAGSRDRRFLRYFSLVHLSNAGISDDELTTYRLALSKLINSLSRNRQIVTPAPVGGNEHLLRLDLRDVSWTSDIWKKLTDATPYAIVFDFPDAKKVYEATETQVPILRGDWFVAAASRPPLYHDVLQIPKTLDELLASLDVDAKRNIAEDRVVRAGFNNSGVSQNNRLIERHDFRDGAFWISYDFAGNTDRRNLFAHPLGPGKEDKHFLHDGGEVIFNLPNGLQGYMLVDGEGKRIDKGPTEIVSDKRRPDRAVQNGVSCMSCHYAGIIAKADEIRAHVLANRSGFVDDAEDILALYKPNDEIARLQKEDAERFQEALKKVGVERVTETNEPVVNMAIRFESNLDLPLAAAELGLKPEEFTSKLQSHPDLLRVLGVVNAGGELKRDVFVKVFRDAVKAFEIGTPVGKVDTPTPAGELAQTPTQGEQKQPPVDDGDAPQKPRTWTDVTGKFKVAAEFVSFSENTVRLRKQDGRVVAVQIAQLSDPDQEFVLKQPPAPTLDLPPSAAGDTQLASNTPAGKPQSGKPDENGYPYGGYDYGYGNDYGDQRYDYGVEPYGDSGQSKAEGEQGAPPLAGPPQEYPVDSTAPRGDEPLFGRDATYNGPPRGYERPRRTPYSRPRPALKYADAPPHQWRPKSHEPFIGTFHDLEAGVLQIRLPNGIVLSGPVADMSPEDLAHVREMMGDAAFEQHAAAPPSLFGP